MADFTRDSVADMASGNPGINMGTTGSMHDVNWGDDPNWSAQESHWRGNFASRPYAQSDRGFEHYAPAYRYGSAAATHHTGHDWTDVESDLERGWEKGRGTSKSAWVEMKDAVRDAWDRVRGQH